MTISDIEKKTHIAPGDLRLYIEEGLLDLDAVQTDDEKIWKDMKTLDELAKIGMKPEALRQMKELMNQGELSKEQQIRFLKKWRFHILDDLHVRQQSLDRLDYMIYTMKREQK